MRLIPIILLICGFVNAQESNYFSNLKKTLVGNNYIKGTFGYDPNATRLIMKKCYELPYKDFLYCEDSSFVEYEKIALYKNSSNTDSIIIVFSQGLSDDPMFSLVNKDQKVLGKFAALEFYITSNGIIYTAGHTNNMFNKRRKFKIENDTVVEIKQPYYYVGLKGKLLKPIIIYSEKELKNQLAQLPVGYNIEILLSESGVSDFNIDYYYLIRTDFGLVGWLKISEDETWETLLKGLYYAGD